jgi:hypothetical protein
VYDVERTQAIQFYFWGASQGSWSEVNPATGVQTMEKANSVPLVANKDLILRVYIDGENAPDLPIPTSVTGKVQYAGHPDLAPINGPISPRRIGMIDRGNANHTLNFPDGLGGEAAARVFVSVSEESRHRDRGEAQEDGVQR